MFWIGQTLYPAVCAGFVRTRKRSAIPTRSASEGGIRRPRSAFHGGTDVGQFTSLTGLDGIDNVLLVDQSPVGKSGRGNPASFMNLFGEIRTLFAQTTDAKVHNFSARYQFHSGWRSDVARRAAAPVRFRLICNSFPTW